MKKCKEYIHWLAAGRRAGVSGRALGAGTSGRVLAGRSAGVSGRALSAGTSGRVLAGRRP